MISVHLRSCEEAAAEPNPRYLLELRRMRELAALDRGGRYRLVDDPSSADMILFMETGDYEATSGPYLDGVRRDPVFREYHRKSCVYSPHDFAVPFVRGIYPSLQKHWQSRSWARSGCYLVGANPYLGEYAGRAAFEPHLLASFVGSMNQPVRHRLAEIREDSILVADNTKAFLAAIQAGRDDELVRLKRGFVETVLGSKFALCPRGVGPSSIRLFEAMELSRAPVILSDAWVAPEGPDWGSFSIRVAERDAPSLPGLLREREAESEALGKAARLAWETWFAPDRLFHRMCETFEELLAARGPLDLVERWKGYLQLARPSHARRLLSRLKNGRR